MVSAPRAARQARGNWRDATSDARACVRLDPLFVKGHVHLGRCLLQQRQPEEAREAVQRGLQALQEAGRSTGSSN